MKRIIVMFIVVLIVTWMSEAKALIFPEGGDVLTEYSATEWASGSASVRDSSDSQVGDKSVELYNPATNFGWIKYLFSNSVCLNKTRNLKIEFYAKHIGLTNPQQVLLQIKSATGTDNKRVYKYLSNLSTNWQQFSIYIADMTADGLNLADINEIRFGVGNDTGTGKSVLVDGLHFTYDNWTYVFSQIQPASGLYQNYQHRWIDRPLMHDRSILNLRDPFTYMVDEGFEREAEMGVDYLFDGFSTITGSNVRDEWYERCLSILDYNDIDLTMMPVITGGDTIDQTLIDRYAQVIETAYDSPNGERLNNKVLVHSYFADIWTPTQLNTLLSGIVSKLTTDGYGDCFYFIADIRGSGEIGAALQAYELGNTTTLAAKKLIYQQRLTDYLDNVVHCDGIYYGGAHHLTNTYEYKYDKTFAAAFYEDELIPLITSVLSEYQDKMLGLSVSVAYINQAASTAKSEDCTKRLRNSMEAVIDYQPDLIILPEWNEFNENTCFSPTVNRSFAVQRIIRYYMSSIREQVPTAKPGDDTTIPNMILTYRQTLKLGDTLSIELLNVPDSNSTGTYTAQLTLKDISGNTIQSYSAETFTIGTLHDVTYTLSTDSTPLVSHRVIVPELVVVGSGGTKSFTNNLAHIRLTATSNDNYTCVMQPLRDIAAPSTHSFSAGTPSGGTVPLSGSITFPTGENIIALEVLEDGEAIYTVDVDDEFDMANNMVILGTLTAPVGQNVVGDIDFNLIFPFAFRSVGWKNSDFDDYTIYSDHVSLNQRISAIERGFIITVPNDDIATGSLDFDLSVGGDTITPFSVSLSTLDTYGAYGKSMGKQRFLRLERLRNLPDHPVWPNINSLSFSCTAYPKNPFPVYHMRAITDSGKIFRSKPIMPFTFSITTPETLNVFSEYESDTESVSVDVAEVPDIVYTFSGGGNYGDLLITTNGDSQCYGEMGNGIPSGRAYYTSLSYYPSAATSSKPQWAVEDGYDCLSFDGIGEYIDFPREIFPHGSFGIEFTIKPTTDKNQVLFRHFSNTCGSLTVKLVTDTPGVLKLIGAYRDGNYVTTQFSTGLSVPVNSWSEIKVSYNLSQLVFTVGANSQSYAYDKRPAAFGACAFGTPIKPVQGIDSTDGFFEGYLRSFQIVHDYLQHKDIGRWHLNEGTGTIAGDSSPYTNDGTLTNMDTESCWVTGQVGNALDFDGINDYINIDTFPADIDNYGSTDGSVTICAWVNPDNVGRYNNITQDVGGINYFSAGTTDSSGKLRCMVWDSSLNGGSGGNTWPQSNGQISSGVWSHVAFVLEAGTGYKFYINGVLDREVSNSNLELHTFGTTAYIGKGGSSTSYFDGMLDEVCVYSRALGSNEIYQLSQE